MNEVKTILRRAARIMFDPSDEWVDGACVAIGRVPNAHGKHIAATHHFELLYKPEGLDGWNVHYWLALPQGQDRPESSEDKANRQLRVFALLLAAESA